MKRSCVFLLCLISVFAVSAKKINVSFQKSNKNEIVKYYLDKDKKNTLDADKINSLEAGSKVYFNYVSQDVEVDGIVIKYFETGSNKVKSSTEASIFEEDGVRYFVIPDGEFFTEISIGLRLKFEDRIISVSATSDGNPVGTWKEYGTPDASYSAVGEIPVNSILQYCMTYNYDSSIYYIESISPKNRVVSAGSGSIIFAVETPGDAKITKEYDVVLKPYTHIQVDNYRKVKSVQINGTDVDPKYMGSVNLKNGALISLATDADCVLSVAGVEIHEVSVTDESRYYEMTIPADNTDYDLMIHTRNVPTKKVKITYENSKGVENGNLMFTYSTGDKEVIHKSNFSNDKITMEDGNKFYVNVTKPSHFSRVVIAVSGDSFYKEYEIVDPMVFVFDYEQVNEVKVSFEPGYRFYHSAINESDIVDVFYTHNGREIEDGTFLRYGDKVYVTVSNCPSDYEVMEEYDIEISSDTTEQTFQVSPQKRAGFWFDPSAKTFEGGEITYVYNGKILSERTFIEQNKEVQYIAQPKDGYHFSDEVNGSIDTTDEARMKNRIARFSFIGNSLQVVSLPQPEYGGRIVYSIGGKVITDSECIVDIGTKIHMKYVPDKGFGLIGELEQNFVVEEGSFETVFNSAFKELDENKPTISISSFKSLGSEFQMVFEYKELDSNNAKVEKRIPVSGGKIQKNDNNFKVGTIAPLRLSLNGYLLESGMVLEVSIDFDNGAGTKTTKRYRTTDTSLDIDIYEIVSADHACEYKKLTITVQKKAGSYFRYPQRSNESIEVYDANGHMLTESDLVLDDETVTVKLTSYVGYYIEGANAEGVYSGTSKYNALNTYIDSHTPKQLIDVTLGSSPEYGICEYSWDKEPDISISENRKLFRVGTKLTLTFTANEEYEIERNLVGKAWTSVFGSSNVITEQLTITDAMDMTKIDLQSFGITVKEKTK